MSGVVSLLDRVLQSSPFHLLGPGSSTVPNESHLFPCLGPHLPPRSPSSYPYSYPLRPNFSIKVDSVPSVRVNRHSSFLLRMTFKPGIPCTNISQLHPPRLSSSRPTYSDVFFTPKPPPSLEVNSVFHVYETDPCTTSYPHSNK